MAYTLHMISVKIQKKSIHKSVTICVLGGVIDYFMKTPLGGAVKDITAHSGRAWRHARNTTLQTMACFRSCKQILHMDHESFT